MVLMGMGQHNPQEVARSSARKRMSGMMRSMPGRSSPAKATPRSMASQDFLRRAETIERQIHADLADTAERRNTSFFF